jgi:hypothetical protein
VSSSFLIFDAIIIGAGAAGLFCAAQAGQRGLKVLLIDHAAQVAEKIRISGGGRCNFTNRDLDVRAPHKHFVGQNPQFCRSALSRFTPADFIALMDSTALPTTKSTRASCLPTIRPRTSSPCCWPSARGRRAALAALPGQKVVLSRQTRHRSEAAIRLKPTVAWCRPQSGHCHRRPEHSQDWRHRLRLPPGPAVHLPLIERTPGLVPMTFDGEAGSPMRSWPVWPCPWKSAPAAKRSAWLPRGFAVHPPRPLRPGRAADLQLLEARHPAAHQSAAWRGSGRAAGRQTRSRKLVANELAAHCPRAWPMPGCSSTRAAAPHQRGQRQGPGRAGRKLSRWEITPTGTEGYKKAEVTLGGVDTKVLSQQTMECKTQPGLYFIGEVVDITGWLGGYNFQWAWASAAACAQALPAHI